MTTPVVYLFFYLMAGGDAHEIMSPPHDTWASCQGARSLYGAEGAITSECFALLDTHDRMGARSSPLPEWRLVW